MRIIVATLFAANLLLLSWNATRPETVNGPSSDNNIESPLADIPTIQLLSEFLTDEAPGAGNRICFSIGPLERDETVAKLREALDANAIHVSQRRTSALVELGFWVFMPAVPTMAEAEALMIEMQAAGIGEVSTTPSRDGQFIVSLGFYYDTEHADLRTTEVAAAGFQARMHPQRENQVRFWLDYEQRPGDDLIGETLAGSGEQAWRRAIPCPDWPEVETRTMPLVSSGVQEGGFSK